MEKNELLVVRNAQFVKSHLLTCDWTNLLLGCEHPLLPIAAMPTHYTSYGYGLPPDVQRQHSFGPPSRTLATWMLVEKRTFFLSPPLQ